MINQNINQRNKRSTVQVVTWRGKNTPFLLFSGPNIFFFAGQSIKSINISWYFNTSSIKLYKKVMGDNT